MIPPSPPSPTSAEKNSPPSRTTVAGSIFPLFAFHQASITPTSAPRSSGPARRCHRELLNHRADAGVSKDLRLDAWEHEHPGTTFRRIATGPRAPDSAFVVSRDLRPDLRDALLAALLNMHKDPAAAPRPPVHSRLPASSPATSPNTPLSMT